MIFNQNPAKQQVGSGKKTVSNTPFSLTGACRTARAALILVAVIFFPLPLIAQGGPGGGSERGPGGGPEGGGAPEETSSSSSILSRGHFRETRGHYYLSIENSHFTYPSESLSARGPNASLANQATGGIFSYYHYAASTNHIPFSFEIGTRGMSDSKTRAWEFFISHKRSNPGFINTFRPYDINTPVGFDGSSGKNLIARGTEQELLVTNRLRSVQMGFNNDFFIFKDNPNRFIQPFGFRLGLLIEGDRAFSEGLVEHRVNQLEYSDGSSVDSLNTLIPPHAQGGVRMENEYLTGQLVIGWNYGIGFFNNTTIDFGMDYHYGTGYGNYHRKKYLIPVDSGLVLPREITREYQYQNTVEGHQWHGGVTFQMEGFGIRLFGEYAKKHYKIDEIKSTTTTDQTALNLVTQNASGIAGDSMPPLGPHPEPVFRNSEIGLEFQVYRN